jgi:hypothetical protein
MARLSATNGQPAVDEERDDWVRRLRKAPVDRVLWQVTDPETARDFWDLVQEVLERDGLRRAVSA